MNSTLNCVDAVLAQLVELGLGDLLVALEEHFAGVLVDDVVRRRPCRPPRSTSTGRRLIFESCSFLMAALGELAVLLDQDLARLRMPDVAGRALAREQVVLDRLLVLLARSRNIVSVA